MKTKVFHYDCKECGKSREYWLPRALSKTAQSRALCLDCAFGGPKHLKKLRRYAREIARVMPATAKVSINSTFFTRGYLMVELPEKKRGE